MSNLLTLLVRNFHDCVWYENDQYPFFMLWMGAGGGGGGGIVGIQRGVQIFHLPFLTFPAPSPFFWPPPSSSFLIAKY